MGSETRNPVFSSLSAQAEVAEQEEKSVFER